MDHYSEGVKRSPTLAKHPDIGLQLTDDEKKALVAFMKTLADARGKNAIDQLAVNRMPSLSGSRQPARGFTRVLNHYVFAVNAAAFDGMQC